MNYLKQRLNGHGGIIVLNPEGHIGIAHNTPRMAWAYKTVKKQEAGVERNQHVTAGARFLVLRLAL